MTRTRRQWLLWLTISLTASLLVAVLTARHLCAAPSQPPLPAGAKADSILILKKAHRMELLSGGRVLRSYKVALGTGGLAAKEREGDARTPEGHYVIDSRNPASHYHLALHISYPNAEDRKRAAKRGVSPGGAIMIHGLPKGQEAIGASHVLYDWTLGCVAVTNEEIEEVWKLVPDGTPVEIRP